MDNKEFQRLFSVQQPLILITSRRKFCRIFLIWAVLVAPLLFIIRMPDSVMEWIIFLSIGFISLVLLKLLVVPYSISLTLDQNGFTKRNLRGENSYLWKNVSEFVPDPNSPKPKAVMFYVQSTVQQLESNNQFERDRRIIFNVYDVSTEQLVQLMNYWRERIIANTEPLQTAPTIKDVDSRAYSGNLLSWLEYPIYIGAVLGIIYSQYTRDMITDNDIVMYAIGSMIFICVFGYRLRLNRAKLAGGIGGASRKSNMDKLLWLAVWLLIIYGAFFNNTILMIGSITVASVYEGFRKKKG